ncbi:hypothetical protein ACFPRL_06925 [Pseudoclavibacter helvolus]
MGRFPPRDDRHGGRPRRDGLEAHARAAGGVGSLPGAYGAGVGCAPAVGLCRCDRRCGRRGGQCLDRGRPNPRKPGRARRQGDGADPACLRRLAAWVGSARCTCLCCSIRGKSVRLNGSFYVLRM